MNKCFSSFLSYPILVSFTAFCHYSRKNIYLLRRFRRRCRLASLRRPMKNAPLQRNAFFFFLLKEDTSFKTDKKINKKYFFRFLKKKLNVVTNIMKWNIGKHCYLMLSSFIISLITYSLAKTASSLNNFYCYTGTITVTNYLELICNYFRLFYSR